MHITIRCNAYNTKAMCISAEGEVHISLRRGAYMPKGRCIYALIMDPGVGVCVGY